MRLYGKDTLKTRLDGIAEKNRMPHAILFCGEKGCGKKVMARYTAQLFLCGAPPCGSCAVCRNIERDEHPDVIYVKRACGGTYAIKELRELLRDTVIKPNNGDIKVYVFEDCGDMREQAQNVLLKLIEEPAPFLRFIFTCENEKNILETILSRVTEFEVPSTEISVCREYLIDTGCDKKRAGELAETFSGNIGKCLDALNGGEEAQLTETARKAAAAVGKRDRYGVSKALSEVTGRAGFSRVLDYFSGILRDAVSERLGVNADYFGKKEAADIAKTFSEMEILNMLDLIFEVNSKAELNPNMALTVSYISRGLF